MPRARARSAKEPLPPPLPPETRTVGQLVAETLRLYGRRFWLALPLGLALAVVNQLRQLSGALAFAAVVVLATIAMAAAYTAASAIVDEKRPARRTLATALAAGVVAFLPLALLLGEFILLGLAWLALVGLAVPAAVIERAPFRQALRRGVRLAQADFVHALGSLATLALVYFLTSVTLTVLLRAQGEQTERVALFLADLVLSPILFLGAALLYFDQAARVVVSGPRKRVRRSRHADVHPADDADRTGRADAEGEPGAAARGQP